MSPSTSLRPLAAAATLALLTLAPPGHAHPVGWATGVPTLEHAVTCDTSALTCILGSPTAPIGITAAGPDATNWLKRLIMPTQFQFSTVFTLIEHIVVGQPGLPGPAWTDWHEHIVDSQWDWVGGTITSGGNVIDGLSVSLGATTGPQGHSNDIWFDFSPLQPGTQIEIRKQFHCHVDVCESQRPILIREYPTYRVSAPAVPLLLATALLAALGLRRRSP